MAKKLTRSNKDKIIAGVSAGLGEYFQLDVVWVRIAFVLATFFGGSGLWIYIILWIAIPQNKITVFTDAETIPLEPVLIPKKETHNFNRKLVAGSLLIILGSYFLLEEFNLIPYWVSFEKLWPLIFIGIGLYMIFKTVRKENALAAESEDKKEDTSVESVDESSDNNDNQVRS